MGWEAYQRESKREKVVEERVRRDGEIERKAD